METSRLGIEMKDSTKSNGEEFCASAILYPNLVDINRKQVYTIKVKIKKNKKYGK